MAKSSRSGSIQSEVPVNPACPDEDGEKSAPAERGGDGVSQPRARLLPATRFALRVKSAMVSGFKRRRPPYAPPFNIICAKAPRLRAVENRPACGATPPR